MNMLNMFKHFKHNCPTVRIGRGEGSRRSRWGRKRVGCTAAPGWHFNSTLALPPLVVRFTVPFPLRCPNLPAEAPRNLKFNHDMFAGRKQDHLVSWKFQIFFICKSYIAKVAWYTVNCSSFLIFTAYLIPLKVAGPLVEEVPQKISL